MTKLIDSIKYTYKAWIAGLGTVAASWLLDNQDLIANKVALAASGVVLWLVTFLKANGPKPS